jgi:DNA modification methylase
MPEGKTIKLTPAKGRPMLQWVGKRPLERVTAFPAQLVERFAPIPDAQGEGLIFHGDNKDVLAWLLANGYRGKINLVYIDPPFDSGANYVRTTELRSSGQSYRVNGEEYTLGEQVQYTDIWTNDSYLQFIYERLLLLKELMAETGSIYFHCDSHKSHFLRCLMDEVFGADRFSSEIIWQRTASHNDPGRYGTIHDTVFFYSKGSEYVWNDPKVPQTKDYIDQFFVFAEGPNREIVRLKKGEEALPGWRRFRLGNFASPHPRPNLTYEYKGYKPPANGWKVSLDRMIELDNQGRLYFPESKEGRIQTRSYLEEVIDGKPAPDLWTDMLAIQAQSEEREDYPTQKPEALLDRIIQASSQPGDLVLDCFAGSGTTAAVAQKLGRRWIVADINKGAVQTASKRLQRIIQEQVGREKSTQLALLPEDAQGEPQPAQLAFAVYRVNDYDLQIQHNEALNLAIEHVGIERLKGDPFFEGTLGKRLVKIIPFNHPLTRLDLQMIQDELKKRSSEDRDIVAVCLGKELAADAWLTEYNHRHPVNKISVIELRTDPRYGKFFEHQPASAEVQVTRKDGIIIVDIEDFISPTILERLEMDTGMFKAKITDWRAMVDTVLIDVAYDGEVFNVALSDVPERKADLVIGHYELPAPAGETTVAVKIIDMLGEEALSVIIV